MAWVAGDRMVNIFLLDCSRDDDCFDFPILSVRRPELGEIENKRRTLPSQTNVWDMNVFFELRPGNY
jgi:hypothetical protein